MDEDEPEGETELQPDPSGNGVPRRRTAWATWGTGAAHRVDGRGTPSHGYAPRHLGSEVTSDRQQYGLDVKTGAWHLHSMLCPGGRLPLDPDQARGVYDLLVDDERLLAPAPGPGGRAVEAPVIDQAWLRARDRGEDSRTLTLEVLTSRAVLDAPQPLEVDEALAVYELLVTRAPGAGARVGHLPASPVATGAGCRRLRTRPGAAPRVVMGCGPIVAGVRGRRPWRAAPALDAPGVALRPTGGAPPGPDAQAATGAGSVWSPEVWGTSGPPAPGGVRRSDTGRVGRDGLRARPRLGRQWVLRAAGAAARRAGGRGLEPRCWVTKLDAPGTHRGGKPGAGIGTPAGL